MTEHTSPPSRGFFITATDTGVGKTYVGTRLVQELTRRGIDVAARKPAESGCEERNGELQPADATALWEAAGRRESLATVCPLRFRHALSPARAAELEGRILTLEMLASAARNAVGNAWWHVEGAGGICSPIARDGLNADLARELGLASILVVPDRLGGINQALMGIAALRDQALPVAAVVLNTVDAGQDPAMDNRGELAAYTSIPVFRSGHGEEADVSALVEYLLGFSLTE